MSSSSVIMDYSINSSPTDDKTHSLPTNPPITEPNLTIHNNQSINTTTTTSNNNSQQQPDSQLKSELQSLISNSSIVTFSRSGLNPFSTKLFQDIFLGNQKFSHTI